MPRKYLLAALALVVLCGIAVYSTRGPEVPQPGRFAVSYESRSSRWPAVRAAHLEREPTCAFCGIGKDLQVHHIIAYHVRPDLELVDGNLITLCGPASHNCHLRWGHLGNYTLWNPEVRTDALRYRAEIQAARKRAGLRD